MADPIGVSVAFDDAMLEAAPTWTRLDTASLVADYSIRRGRTDEFERTGTGTATIRLNDRSGLFDPTNAGSPYDGLLDAKQAALALRNPVTDTWATIFRGFIEDWGSELDPSQVVTRLEVPLVDGMAYLAAVELTPDGRFGTATASGSIVYPATPTSTVDDRINAALDDAGWSAALREIFTGNVRLQKSVYSAGESVLSVIQEAGEAEFPGIANFYFAKDGKATFHGRLARFNPSDEQYHIDTWKLGDGAAILADPTVCQIRALSWSRPRQNVINSAFCTPQDPDGLLDRSAQVVTDPTSIAAYGLHSWSAEGLRIAESVITGNSAAAECLLYAQFYIDNYKDPRTRIDRISVRSLDPSNPRAAAVWAFMCGVEISDIVHLKTTHPGGGGFDEDFYVEGLSYGVSPLQPEFQNVELVLDVSPKAYYDAIGGLGG